MFVAIALLVAWENRAYPLGSLSEPGPGYMPLALAVALGAFGLVVMLRGHASPLLDTIDWTEGRRAIVLVPEIALTVPNPEEWSLDAICERDGEGRYASLAALLQQCTDTAYTLSEALSARYFTHSGDTRYSVGA